MKFRHPDRVPHVHVSATRVEDSWEFECRDNGIGIDPQYAERVFVIFQRLHAKDLYEGTGIGLALCKKIVEFHGGRIWIPETAGGRHQHPLDAAGGRGRRAGGSRGGRPECPCRSRSTCCWSRTTRATCS